MNKILRFLFGLILAGTLLACQTSYEDEVVIILIPGVDTVEVNSEFTDAGALSTVYGSVTENEVIYNNVDITVIGTYEITYQVEYRTVTKTVTRIVNVIDETAPVGTLNPGIDSILVGSEWVDASVSVSDNSLGDVTITVIGTVNTNISGEYIITYQLEDESGNQSSLIRYVFVYEVE